MVVSIDRPARTAVIELPLPRVANQESLREAARPRCK